MLRGGSMPTVWSNVFSGACEKAGVNRSLRVRDHFGGYRSRQRSLSSWQAAS
jgi:hypothetical protein